MLLPSPIRLRKRNATISDIEILSSRVRRLFCLYPDYYDPKSFFKWAISGVVIHPSTTLRVACPKPVEGPRANGSCSGVGERPFVLSPVEARTQLSSSSQIWHKSLAMRGYVRAPYWGASGRARRRLAPTLTVILLALRQAVCPKRSSFPGSVPVAWPFSKVIWPFTMIQRYPSAPCTRRQLLGGTSYSTSI